MLCRNRVLLAVFLDKSHHVVTDLSFLRQHVIRKFMAIKCKIAADRQFIGTQLMCAVRGNLAGFFCSVAAHNGHLLLTQIVTTVENLELCLATTYAAAIPRAFLCPSPGTGSSPVTTHAAGATLPRTPAPTTTTTTTSHKKNHNSKLKTPYQSHTGAWVNKPSALASTQSG